MQSSKRFLSLVKHLKSKSIANIGGVNNSYIQAFYLSNQANSSGQIIKTHTNGKLSYATTINSDFNLLPDTLGDLIKKNAKEKPNDICYTFPHNGGLNLSFLELEQRVNQMAQSLLNLGLQKGDRLAIILPNTHEFVITFLACATIGVIAVCINPIYQIVEIEYMLKKSNAKAVLFYDTFRVLNHYDIIKKLIPELDNYEPGNLNSSKLPDLKHVIVLNSPLVQEKKSYKGTWRYENLAEAKISQNTTAKIPHIENDDPFALLFTSGTTGMPKGVALKHLGVVNCAYYAAITSFNNIEGFGTTCVPIPLFHLFGLAMGLVCSLVTAHTTVFSFFAPDTLASMKSIQNYKCKSYFAPPTLFVDLLNHPERKNYNLSSLKNTLIGASTVPPDLLKLMKDELKIKNIVVGYGLTESSLLASLTTAADANVSFKKAYESIGRPIGFLEAKIIDSDSGKILPLNSDGELCLRGFNIIKEYWNEPKKSQESIDKNGWFRTGDVCHMDEDGYLYFKSRSKDIIIRGGTNIYPAEVEAFLRTNPKVIDVCVFGVPDTRLGEEVAAWFRLKPNQTLSIEDVIAFCEDKIAKFKIPKYIKIVDNFPINPNGKVMRNKVIELAKAELKLL